MRTIPPHSACRSPARFARKYGPAFNTFDHLANVSLCTQELGPVHIDCRFRHSKTQLGVLGTTKNQAGILYVDLSFSNPKDCPLTSAVVWISLEEGEEDEQKSTRGQQRKRTKPTTPLRPSRNTNPSGEPEFALIGPHERKARLLQFTHDCFGPHQLEGRPTNVTTKNIVHLTPEVNILGNGGGGLGYDREKTFTQSSRWSFTGTLLPNSRIIVNPGNEDGSYRTLRWELSGDDFQPQSTHSNVIQTAFTLEHDMDPFFIRVEIQGKLRRSSERLKSNIKQLLRFPSVPQKEEAKSMILVLPDKQQMPKRRLDPIAKGLRYQMEQLNLGGVRVQLPDSLPVSFQDAFQAPRDSNAKTETAVEDSTDPVVFRQGQQSRLPRPEPPDKLPSPLIEQPITQPMESRPPPMEETPVVAGNPLILSQTSERKKQVHDNSQYPVRQIQIGRGTEGEDRELSNSKFQPKPVLISPTVDYFSQNSSEKDLDKLAAQIAQFPVLIVIFEWLVYVIAFLPAKVKRKGLKAP